MNTICLDKQNNGKCTKNNCDICSINIENILLNKEAKPFVPKSKIQSQKEENKNLQTENITYNLNAKEFKPKNKQEDIYNIYNIDHEDFEEDEIQGQEFDMIVKDIIDNEALEELEGDESDEDKWYPKFKDCECCKGHVYKCKGSACLNLGVCFCKMKEECDEYQ